MKIIEIILGSGDCCHKCHMLQHTKPNFWTMSMGLIDNLIVFSSEEKVIFGNIDEVPTQGLSRSFPLLLKDDLHMDGLQHVSMDLFPSHEYVSIPLGPTHVLKCSYYLSLCKGVTSGIFNL